MDNSRRLAVIISWFSYLSVKLIYMIIFWYINSHYAASIPLICYVGLYNHIYKKWPSFSNAIPPFTKAEFHTIKWIWKFRLQIVVILFQPPIRRRLHGPVSPDFINQNNYQFIAMKSHERYGVPCYRRLGFVHNFFALTRMQTPKQTSTCDLQGAPHKGTIMRRPFSCYNVII